jgi:hypothetical protein
MVRTILTFHIISVKILYRAPARSLFFKRCVGQGDWCAGRWTCVCISACARARGGSGKRAHCSQGLCHVMMMMMPFICSYRNKNEPTAIYPSMKPRVFLSELAWLPKVVSLSSCVHACAGYHSECGPVYNTDSGSLPLVARQIGLQPHVDDYDQLQGAVHRPGGDQFETTPVRVLSLHSGMCAKSQVETLAQFTVLWYRALSNRG